MEVHLKNCKYLQEKHFVLFLDFILPEKEKVKEKACLNELPDSKSQRHNFI